MLQIDLRTSVIPPGRRVWRLFPGESYKFLAEYKKQGGAFLDVPEFPMPRGSLKEDGSILQRIVAAQDAVDAFRKSGIEPQRPLPIEAQPGVRQTQRRVNFRQSLISFFDVANEGDLIVVPNQLWLGTVLIGQFSSPAESHQIYHAERYGNLHIPGRTVNWLVEFDENKLSSALSRSLRHQNPFSLIERSRYHEIYSIVYENFVFADEYSSVIYNTKDDFLDKDSALIGDLARICAYYAYNTDENNEAIRPPGLIDLISNDVPLDYACQQSSDIHSPGFVRFVSSRYTSLMLPALIAAMLALSGCENPQELRIERTRVEFVNTKSQNDDACMPHIYSATKAILANTDIDQLFKMCKALKEAELRAGLKINAQAEAR